MKYKEIKVVPKLIDEGEGIFTLHRVEDKGFKVEFSRVAVIHNNEDANLFKDAFNTIQKCDLLPSELLERYNEAIEALKDSLDCSEKGDYQQYVITAQELIKKHES